MDIMEDASPRFACSPRLCAGEVQEQLGEAAPAGFRTKRRAQQVVIVGLNAHVIDGTGRIERIANCAAADEIQVPHTAPSP